MTTIHACGNINMITLTNIMIVSEEMIVKGSEYFGDSNNMFNTALLEADMFREAELTPVYLYDTEKDTIKVTSVETLKKLYS